MHNCVLWVTVFEAEGCCYKNPFNSNVDEND